MIPRSSRSRAAVCLSLVVATAVGGAAAPARAQAPPPAPAAAASAYVTPDYIRRAPALPAGRDGARALRLPLAAAIETALRRNLRLDLQREQVREVETLRGGALGAFEPLIDGVVRRQEGRSPPTTRQEGDPGSVLRSESTSWRLGLSQRLPTGTELRVDLLGGISESSLGTAVLPEVARTSFSFGVSQPVLRGFSFSGRVQTAPLLRARFASEAALEQARLQAMITVNATENAYWDLVERIKSYEVVAGALDLARRQLDLTRRQIAAGITPESQVISAEATLAQRELALVQAEVQIDAASDRLRALLNLPEADWDRPLLPVDTPSFLPVEIAVAPALERARAARPDLKGVQIDLRRVALDLDVARNDRLPRLDLQAGYEAIGQDPRLGRSFDQALRATGRGWSVGLALAWAPVGTAARAEIRRLESALRQNALGREQVLLAIRAEIRDAVRALETAERQLRAAARSRELTERSLDVDQRRFVSGLTDNFVIAQRQAEVAAARQAELSALIGHEKAASDLQLAMGDLLEARKLAFSVGPGAS